MALTADTQSPPVDPASVMLRRGGMADLKVLAGLYHALYAAYGEAFPDAVLRKKVADRLGAGCTAILFEHDGTAIGSAVFIDIGDHVFLLTYVIAPDHRARGLGGALFARLRDEIIGADREIRLEATGDFAPGFWQAQGFDAWTTGMRRMPLEGMP